MERLLERLEAFEKPKKGPIDKLAKATDTLVGGEPITLRGAGRTNAAIMADIRAKLDGGAAAGPVSPASVDSDDDGDSPSPKRAGSENDEFATPPRQPAPLTASLFTVRPWDRGCAGIVSVTRASSAPVADTTRRRSSSMFLRKAEFWRKNGNIWPSGVEIS